MYFSVVEPSHLTYAPPICLHRWMICLNVVTDISLFFMWLLDVRQTERERKKPSTDLKVNKLWNEVMSWY